jgi:hypothetical protein
VRYRGREIDPVALWDRYVEFPAGMDREDMFSPLVFCPNPAHDNTASPAFQVNLREPLVHCFSRCGIEGTYEHAIAIAEGLYEKFNVHEAMTKQETIARSNRARREAKKIILRGATGISHRPHQPRATIQRPKTVVLDYQHFLPPVAVEYLRKRGIDESAISFWEIGWDKDEKRIVIPAHDENGKLKFLIKRAVLTAQNPKYLYSQDAVKTALLFGAGKVEPQTTIVLTEGSFDVIKLTQHGFNAVGILGSGISDRQVEILSRLRPKRVVLMFDKDIAGVKNIENAMLKLKKYPLFVCRYPKGKSDPAELKRSEAHYSVENAVQAALWRARIGAKSRKPIRLAKSPRDR